MPDPAATAGAQLERILYILVAARGEEGIGLAELAARLGVEPGTVRDDIAQVTGREFYHPAASVMEMTILLERERVSVPLAGEFRRPRRLTPREAGVLGLALRARAAELADPRRQELLDLARALESALASPAKLAAASPAELARRVEVDPGGAADGLRLLLERAIAARTPVHIRYLKPGEVEPSGRVVHPYALVAAEGAWYVVAFSPERDAVRLFRLDRVLAAEPREGRFEIPTGFDPAEYVRGAWPYRAQREVEAVVHYSARVAPWVLEQGWGWSRGEGEAGGAVEVCADGSVVVRHGVANPRWLVRHVLQYAGDAVVQEPAELRRAVREAGERIAATQRTIAGSGGTVPPPAAE